MKQRLPLLTPGPIAERAPARAQRAKPLARAAVDRPLVCVTDGRDGVRAARFAYGLARALRARGANVAALLVSQPHRSGGESARQLEGLGARPVAVLSEAELPQAALQVLHELPQTVVVIAVGPSLAESLQGLLTVLVGPEPRAIGHEPGPADAIDLQLELELEGVATRIADWLASEVASR